MVVGGVLVEIICLVLLIEEVSVVVMGVVGVVVVSFVVVNFVVFSFVVVSLVVVSSGFVLCVDVIVIR